MSIGEKIRELRLENNLLQRELAAKIHIAANTLSQFESGKANPSYDVLIALANIFQVSTDFLLCRSDDFGNITIPPAELPPDEQRLLDLFRKLNRENRVRLTAYAEIRLEEQSDLLARK